MIKTSSIKSISPLGFQWETNNPFLFCVHHKDNYPPGNEEMGPNASLSGRNIGNDFTLKDGWRMYHGDKIPGFPVHPHRGFETITIVLRGMVDHADSLGASGRYGEGDVQWMTAGAGIQHTEMFPLLNRKKDNPLELFQIWLNLPAADKFVNPYYTMLWKEKIPVVKSFDGQKKLTEIMLIAGTLNGEKAPPPPPDSWAAKEKSNTCIFLIKMAAGAKWTLPMSSDETERSLYYYRGNGITVNETEIHSSHAINLKSGFPTKLENGLDDSYLLLLQSAPIKETVVQYGPFVMNSKI
jgi:redox-sensitive bicupin YhaK (pirin superfamily)